MRATPAPSAALSSPNQHACKQLHLTVLRQGPMLQLLQVGHHCSVETSSDRFRAAAWLDAGTHCKQCRTLLRTALANGLHAASHQCTTELRCGFCQSMKPEGTRNTECAEAHIHTLHSQSSITPQRGEPRRLTELAAIHTDIHIKLACADRGCA